MIIKGDYGTIFECAEMAGGADAVLVTTELGSLEVPATDLAMFYIGYWENYNARPVQVNEKASKYVKAAITAAIEHLQSQLAAAEKREKELREAIKARRQWQKCPRCNKTFATNY